MAAGSVGSNVYTVLVFVAFVALTTAAVFLWMRSDELFGDDIKGNAFEIVPRKSTSLVVPDAPDWLV